MGKSTTRDGQTFPRGNLFSKWGSPVADIYRSTKLRYSKFRCNFLPSFFFLAVSFSFLPSLFSLLPSLSSLLLLLLSSPSLFSFSLLLSCLLLFFSAPLIWPCSPNLVRRGWSVRDGSDD